jgi:hypothetical protein
MASSSSELEADAAREVAVRSLSLGQVSRLLEALARLEQVRGQIGPTEFHTKALDEAAAGYDGAAVLPECAPVAGARLDGSLGLVKRAIHSGLAHDSSFGRRDQPDIRACPSVAAGFY